MNYPYERDSEYNDNFDGMSVEEHYDYFGDDY